MTAAAKSAAIKSGLEVTESTVQKTDGSWEVLVRHPDGPLRLSFYYPGITDVRMPLFVLAVFYTGLFFLMSTRKG